MKVAVTYKDSVAWLLFNLHVATKILIYKFSNQKKVRAGDQIGAIGVGINSKKYILFYVKSEVQVHFQPCNSAPPLPHLNSIQLELVKRCVKAIVSPD